MKTRQRNFKSFIINSIIALLISISCISPIYNCNLPFKRNPFSFLLVGLRYSPKYLGYIVKSTFNFNNAHLPFMPNLVQLFNLGTNAPFSNEVNNVDAFVKYYFFPVIVITLIAYISIKILEHMLIKLIVHLNEPTSIKNTFQTTLLFMLFWLIINLITYYSKMFYYNFATIFALFWVFFFIVCLLSPVLVAYYDSPGTPSSGNSWIPLMEAYYFFKKRP